MFSFLFGFGIGFFIGLIVFERPQWATDAWLWIKAKITKGA